MKTVLKLCLCLIFLFTSCKKEDKGYDYRDKYIGKYDFNIKYSYPNYKWVDSLQYYIVIYRDSNYFYSGFVLKSDFHYNKIIADWGSDTIAIINNNVFTQKSEFTIDSIGNLCYPEYGGSGHSHLYPPSYIYGDTMCFTICSGGLGSYSCWNVNGLKIK